MIKAKDIIIHLENLAPLNYQEEYDNCGLLIGNNDCECNGILITLDVTLSVIEEAIQKKCNLIIAHHPLIFKGIKKINNQDIIEQIIYKAIQNNILIYAIHTNLDNIKKGVNDYFAKRLGLINTSILLPKKKLNKIHTYIPLSAIDKVCDTLFKIGAGHIGNYSECSFRVLGEGSFKGNENTSPFIGVKNIRHIEKEYKLEIIFPEYLAKKVVSTLKENHPYEEVAYDIFALENEHLEVGSGMIGEIKNEMDETAFLSMLKQTMNLKIIKHSPLFKNKIKKVAVCGGSGAFLIPYALKAKADIFITADLKYHDYFLHENKIILCDIGHYESEIATIDLIYDYLINFFPKFALFKTQCITNPISHF